MNAAADRPADVESGSSASRVAAGGHDWHVVHVTAAHARTGGARVTRPACLCLHGTGASSHSMLALAASLASTHDVWIPDLPGHAATRTPRDADLSIRGVADAVGALLTALDVRPALLVGHSAGAVVLAQHLMGARDAGARDGGAAATPPLVSLAGSLLPLGGAAGALFPPLARLAADAGWVARLFARRAGADRAHVRRLLAGTGSDVPAASVDAYRALLSDPGHVAGVLRLMASWRLDAFARRLPALEARVHLLGGTRDRTIPPVHQTRLRRLLPRATLDMLDPLGHLLHEEAPGRVAATLRARLGAEPCRGDAPAGRPRAPAARPPTVRSRTARRETSP